MGTLYAVSANQWLKAGKIGKEEGWDSATYTTLMGQGWAIYGGGLALGVLMHFNCEGQNVRRVAELHELRIRHKKEMDTMKLHRAALDSVASRQAVKTVLVPHS